TGRPPNGSSARRNCCRPWGWPIRSTNARRNYRAASSNAWPWPGPWPRSPSSSWPTSRPPTSIRSRPPTCSTSWPGSTGKKRSPSFSPPTTNVSSIAPAG
ncbi:MAG: hypothetical protein KDC43_21480, partial [Saprospiraceae bacterium]|nr:hypothetical protein [Saprospiraceae bacterium]